MNSKENEADSNGEGEIIKSNERLLITTPVAHQSYLQLRQYFQENSLSEKLCPSFDQIEGLLIKDQMSKLRQTKIVEFFAPQ